MTFSIKSSLVRSAALIVLSAFMTGCEHSPQLNMSRQTSGSGCSSNPYLMKYDCSISRIQHAAENGNADAQYALGYMYYYGIDTTQDRQTAELWIQRSAAQGQPLAKKAWFLINSGATFSDLHKTAANQVAQVSHASSTITQQEPADVEKLNATMHAEPITSHLPGYHTQHVSSKSESVLDSSASSDEGDATITATTASAPRSKNMSLNDPRLASSSKAIVANAPGKVSTSKMASNTLINKASDYTVQLMGSDKLHDLKSFIAQNNLGDAAHYYKTKMNGKPWYMLIYGNYKTPSQAEIALKQLPSAALAYKPWVKSVATVQKEVRSQKIIA